MLDSEKIKEELLMIKHSRKEALQQFETAKKQLIKIIENADAETMLILESKYQVVTDIKTYAKRIEIMDAKIRTIEYIMSE